MSLQSKLFRGDARLEAAAISDPAHIALGARGPHVGKIQQALVQLDEATISQDSIYGPATAAAVKAYKRARDIVDRRRQAQADDIVGIMTMAALDREMLAEEDVVSGPIQIRPVLPGTRPAPSSGVLLLGFKIDVDFPVFPNGTFQTVRLDPRSTGSFEIVNGSSGTVRCTNAADAKGDKLKICFMFDPADPNVVQATRLNPVRRGPLADSPFEVGGNVRVTNDPFTVRVDALHPGNAFIDASTARSANRLVLEVRAPKIVGLPTFPPPTKTRANSTLVSAADSEANISGRGEGRPVRPKGTGRKINIFGSGETPGFEDYTTDLGFSSFTNVKDGRPDDGSSTNTVFRPWTEDRAVGVGKGEASDICIRDSPIFPVTINTIRRIAAPGCRLTFSGTDKAFIPILKGAFTGAKILEEFSDALVMELL